jgi:hypothetical protein
MNFSEHLPGLRIRARECWRLDSQSLCADFLWCPELAVWHRNNSNAGHVPSLRMRGLTWEIRGHHEYDPTEECVCMPDAALTGVCLESDGAWFDFILLSVATAQGLAVIGQGAW